MPVDNTSAIEKFRISAMASLDRGVELKTQRIKRIALKAADAEANRLFKVIARDYVNKSSTPGPLSTQGVFWAPLDTEYALRKGHSRFFYYTGQLRNELSGMSGVAEYGKSTATVSRGGKVGSMQLSIRPFSFLSSPYDSSVLEVFSPSMRVKLAGRGTYRPLIDPAIAHFWRYRIPRAINRALRAAGYRAGRG